MSATGRERWCQALLALLLFISYAYFLPRRVDWNQNGRMDLVLAIVDQGRLEIDDYVGNTGDYAHFGGHYYCDKAPGVSFLGVPFYWAFRQAARLPGLGTWMARLAGRLASSPASPQEAAGLFPWRGYFALALYATTLGAVALPSVLLGLLVYRGARRLGAGAGTSALLTLVYGLGTMAFPYGSALYGHMLAAACLFGAFYLLWGWAGGRRSAWRALLAGLLLGWAVVTEYPMVLPAGVLGLYGLYRLRSPQMIGWLALGAALPAALLAGYDLAIYGSPLPMGYAYSELWQEEVQTGFMTLTAPSLERLWGITFSPYRGLFFLSPALLAAFPGFVVWWRRREQRPEWWTCLLVIAVLLLFNASSVVWWGGFAVGPRYIAPAVPFLMPAIAAWLARGGWRRPLFAALGALSIFEVWAQTITALKFYPPEMYRFPLMEYALPLLRQGQIAANLGMALGLAGAWSLLPLMVIMAVVAAGLAWVCRAPAGGAA